MKLIFVAKKAFDAYLINSALSRSVDIIGASIKLVGRYSSRNKFSDRLFSTPITTLSGRIKSEIAAPSLKNSGFDATSKSASGFRSLIIFFTFLAVPTGTVDLSTTTVYPSNSGAKSSAA